MIAMLPSFDRRALRRSSLVLVGAAALAACNNDAPLAPKAAPQSTNQAILTNGAARVSWNAVDLTGTPVGGATFVFNYDANNSAVIADNSTLDLDKRPGWFEVVTNTQGGGVCQVSPPAGWVFVPMGCFGMAAPPGQTTFFISFRVEPLYSFYWYSWDGSSFAGPGTYRIRSASGSFDVTIEDNGKGDRWSPLGYMYLIVPEAGEYRLCQTKAPPGTRMSRPSCIDVIVTLGEPQYATTFINNPI